MKNISVFICILSFLTWPSNDLSAQDKGWIKHRSVEGVFAIEAPGSLSHKAITTETALGPLEYEVFFFQPEMEEDQEQGIFLYQLSYCDYPPQAVHADSSALLEDFFTQTMEAAAESVNGELMYGSTETAYDHPGYVWRIDYLDGKAVIRTRSLLVGNRFYSWQVVCSKDYSLSSDITRFLDSFRLLGE